MRSDAYRRFTAKLVEARTAAKLSQREVAEAIGLPQPRISEMETGERRVDVIELAAMAKLYKKSLKWFVSD